ncbi:RNA polymerase subunit sigma-70 [Prevotella sp. P5-126]|uniref:RNA polymerase sigma factor n=1 Tax=Xylanibacter brevis TaxID=83231 RepID=A0ABS9CCT0_9BACT|nr:MULTISPECIES: RNA polymerase sigma factor [Prevotellaceae]MBS7319892.1 RNA polymerase sigma factor [Prevotella sp.]MCF2559359.1 RNA polymerase sigma factor [Xylanibacter brevis]MCF2562920.1 RNA polymerase sigma factor [Xylanibacter brevis]MCI7001198.1 RNA polymerase sigma factor [Prevotella sp.]MDY4684378.1 RNA polymerase sigma factor [Prevotella sp.]
MQSLTDFALVTQVTMMGNRRAFDQLVVRYQSPVRRFFLHQTLGDEPLSDDLAQDTFIKAWRNIGSFRAMSSFQTWLMRIAYNVFYDYVRSRKTTSDIDNVAEPMTNGNSNPSLQMDLYHALSLLKPDERTCITLQLVDGYKIDQIAKITDMKEGTVKSILFRGKEKLTKYLKQNGYG